MGVFVVAAGGSARGDRTLTLDDALALARVHNRDLRAARTHVAVAVAGVEQARAALLPTIAAQGKYTHNYKEVTLDVGAFSAGTNGLAEAIRATTTSPAEAAAITAFEQQSAQALAAQPAIVIQKGDQLDASITATMPLIAPSAYFGMSAARSTVRASAATFEVTEAIVLVTVAQAYFAAAGADELLVARQDAVKVADETFAVAKARVGSELANPVDVTRAETALVRAQQDLAEAANTQATTYRALVTLLGTHETIHVQPAAIAEVTPAAIGELVTGALTARPELAADRATVAAATATSRAAAWRWAPTLSGFANYRAFNYTGFSGDRYAWSVGLQLDWLLYDGGLRDAQRHVALAQRAEAAARLDLETDSISDEVANSRGTFETKRKGVEAADRAVGLAREALRLVRAQYDAGTAKQLDVLQAQDSLVAAEVGLAEAHFDVSLAELQLRRASGTFPDLRKAPR